MEYFENMNSTDFVKKQIEDGDTTVLAEKQIYDLWNADEMPEELLQKSFKDYIEFLSKNNLFYEKTKESAHILGYSGKNAEDLVEFIQERCIAADLYFSKDPKENKKTLKRWFVKGNPPTGDNGRENVYKLCFILQMDADATMEFFMKGFLERPFDYKDVREATYFFCMKNGLGYADAEWIVDQIERSKIDDLSDADEVTAVIGNEIAEMNDKTDFIKYMSENSWNKRRTVSKELEQLLEDCKKLAEIEYERFIGEKIAVKTIEDLLYVIYGYRARLKEDGRDVYYISIAKSRLPEYIKTNFPQLQQFKNIEKGSASYDTIRKAYIMLYFYKFYANARIKKIEPRNKLYDEFLNSLDIALNRCGYIQHYWRNPYDWMICYCAYQNEPLDTLRNIIEEYYLSDFEERDEE